MEHISLAFSFILLVHAVQASDTELGTEKNPAACCEEIKWAKRQATSDAYFLKDGAGGASQVYCFMDAIKDCGEGPWTLVIKADGTKSTFDYDSLLWQNKETYIPQASKSGLAPQETKTVAFHTVKFTKLCLGMRVRNFLQWIPLDYPNDKTLFDVLADNTYRATDLGRDQWKKLIPGSSLQPNCNMEGFNVNIPSPGYASARIGIISNQENECLSPDSRIGFGTGGFHCGQDGGNSVGNEARCEADNGDRSVRAFGYILIQKETVPFDPCTDVIPTVISDVFRSTAYKVPPGGDYKCDMHLEKGWYQFESEAGNEMPTSLVENNYCGTYRPIWMLGPHPGVADGVVEVEVCGNPKTQCTKSLSYMYKWKIKVRNCGSHYLYFLKPVPICNLAYCAGNKKPCPPGHLSSTGDKIGVNCSVAYPSTIPTPTIRATTSFSASATGFISHVVLLCEFEFEAWDNVTFEVQWIVDGMIEKEEKLNEQRFSEIGEKLYTQDEETTGGFVAGSRAQCKLRSRFNNSPAVAWGPYKESQPFYAGIEVEPKFLTTAENDVDKTIRLTSNIPIKCPDETGQAIDCSLRVNLHEGGEMAFSQCAFELNKQNNYSDTIQLRTVRDFKDQFLHDLEIAFGITLPEVIDNIDLEAFFWSFYTAESIPIRVKVSRENVASGMCRSTGDPHITTFDNYLHHLLGSPGPGDYVLAANPKKHFEVQTRVWPCWQVLCNCGVVIRDKNDVIKIDMCNGRWMQTSEDVVQLSHQCLSKKFEIKRTGNHYEIWLASGREVRVDVHNWGMNVYIQTIPDDNGVTEGLCGNFNGNPNDELEGMSHETFLRTYKRKPSLFDAPPEPLDEEKDVCICADSNEVNRPGRYIDCDVLHNHKIQGSDVKVLRSTTYCPLRRRRRDDTAMVDDGDAADDDLSDNVEYMFGTFEDFEPLTPSWPTVSGITQTQAEEYCGKLIRGTAAGKTCAEDVGIELDKVMEDCVLDIKISDDLSIAQSSVEAMLQQCTFQAFKNVSLYEESENGTLVPPVQLLNILCPGDCNLHGNCSNGTCTCDEGFIGADCSQSLKESPQLFRLAKDGLCDVRKYGCRIARATGQGFIETSNLECLIKEMKFSSGIWLLQDTIIKLSGVIEGTRKIRCPLPTHLVQPVIRGDNRRVRREAIFDQPGTPAAGYMVAVANGNSTISNELRVTLFDSVCMDCDSQGNCTSKSNSCEINGYCFAADDPKPEDWCQQCLPDTNNSTWSRRQVNLLPSFNMSSEYRVFFHQAFTLQLSAADPENRPIHYSLDYKPMSDITLTPDGQLTISNTTNNETFHVIVRVTDECNATTALNLTFTVLICQCENDALCALHNGTPVCICPYGLTGSRCESSINECLAFPCVNGTCKDLFQGYQCLCSPGFTSQHCEVEVDECLSSPCFAGVQCSDQVNGFECEDCPVGYNGDGITCTEISTQKNEGENVKNIIIIVVVCTVSLALVILLCTILYKKYWRQSTPSSTYEMVEEKTYHAPTETEEL